MELNMKYFDLYNDDKRVICAPMDLIVSRFIHNSSNLLIPLIDDSDLLDRDFSLGYYFATRFTSFMNKLINDLENHQVELRLVWKKKFRGNRKRNVGGYINQMIKWDSVDRARLAFSKDASIKNRKILHEELGCVNIFSSVRTYIKNYYEGMAIYEDRVMEYCKSNSEFIYIGYELGYDPKDIYLKENCHPRYGLFGINLKNGLKIKPVSS